MGVGANAVLKTSPRLQRHYRYPDSIKVGRKFIILRFKEQILSGGCVPFAESQEAVFGVSFRENDARDRNFGFRDAQFRRSTSYYFP